MITSLPAWRAMALRGVFSPTQSLIAQFGGFWADPNYGGAAGMAAQPVIPGAGWSGASWAGSGLGPYTHTPGATTDLTNAVLIVGNRYSITFTVAVTAGSVTCKAGTAAGTARSTAGTFTEELICAGSTGAIFTPSNDFAGTVTVVSIVDLSIVSLTPRYAAALNCLADGDCEDSGTAAWTQNPALCASKTAGRLRVTTTGTYGYAYQLATIVGRRFRIRGRAWGDGVDGVPRIYCGGALVWNGTPSTTEQAIDATFVANSTDVRAYVRAELGAGGFADFDNLVLTDVSTPAGILAQSTAADQPWLPSTTVNGRRVLRFADTDVLLGSLAAPAWRFLHCGSGGTLPRWIYNRNLNSSSLAAINTILRTYAAGTKAGVWVYVTTAGAITVTWYDATGAVLQTAASANGAVVAGTAYAITVWVDGTSFGVLKNGADAIAATAMTFTPDMTLPSNYQSGNGTGTPIVGLCSNEVLVAGYRDAASTLALHREQASQWGIAA